jgi:formate/nitrite transporter FocA (FNT family)
MFLDTVDQFAKISVAKAAYLRRSAGGFFIGSMLAGAYVGLGYWAASRQAAPAAAQITLAAAE